MILPTMNPKRDLWLAALASVLAVNVVVAFHFYDVGKRNELLKNTRAALATVVAQKAVIQKQRDSVGAALAVAEKKSAVTRTVYLTAKAETKIVGDSAFDSTGHFIQVLDPRISQRIVKTDEHVISLEKELLTAKFMIHVDTVFVAKQNEEIDLNKRIAKMVEGPKCGRKCGIVIGVVSTASVVWLASKVPK